MAKVVSTQVITCPECGAQAVVRTWSCGCQDVTGSYHHKAVCSRPVNFEEFEKYCGEHGTSRRPKPGDGIGD